MLHGMIYVCLKIQKYTPLNPDVAASELKAFKRHLWYLCPEMVPLALFNDIVPKLELQYLAERLLEVQPGDNVTLSTDCYGTGFGKPKFSNDNINAATRLGDLVSSDS